MILAACVAAATLLASGCGGSTPSVVEDEDGGAIHKTFERGPIRVALHVDHDTITLAERLELSLEITVSEAYEVELPRFGEKLEQFGIVDYRTTQPELIDGGRKRVRRSYVLEPFLSGDYTIPAMTVKFRKHGEEGEAHELETEALTIRVTSLLPEDVEDLEINEVTEPVDLPRRKRPWLFLSAAGLALLAAGGAMTWCLRRRGRGVAEAVVMPPHERAFEALEKLVAEDLVEQGRIKTFYQRLSEILRRYIEERFGLHAPEQTTEEFLEGLRSDEALNNRYRSLLADFLTQCDLVKFAEHQPGRDDIQKAFDSCKSFILGTQPADGEAS